jgi:hypothetical protein
MEWESGSDPGRFMGQRPHDTQKTGSWLRWLGYTRLNGSENR